MKMAGKRWVLLILLCVVGVVLTLEGMLRPKKGSVSRAAPSPADDVTPVDVKEINDNLQTILADIRKMGDEQSKHTVEVVLHRDPFLVHAAPAATAGARPAGVQTILRGQQEMETPSLVLSGILYDETRPMAIIGNAVRGVNDHVGPFTVVRILPEKVVLSRNDRLFTLTVRSDEQTAWVGDSAVMEPQPAPSGTTAREAGLFRVAPLTRTESVVQPAAFPPLLSGAESLTLPVPRPATVPQTLDFVQDGIPGGDTGAHRVQKQRFDATPARQTTGNLQMRDAEQCAIPESGCPPWLAPYFVSGNPVIEGCCVKSWGMMWPWCSDPGAWPAAGTDVWHWMCGWMRYPETWEP